MSLATTVHVFPLADLIEHEVDGELCVCGPHTEWLITQDGSTGKVITHHSLDGRELAEPDLGR